MYWETWISYFDPWCFFKTYLIDVLKFMFPRLGKKGGRYLQIYHKRIQQLDGFHRMEHQCGATTRLARFGYRSLRIEGWYCLIGGQTSNLEETPHDFVICSGLGLSMSLEDVYLSSTSNICDSMRQWDTWAVNKNSVVLWYIVRDDILSSYIGIVNDANSRSKGLVMNQWRFHGMS